MSPRSGNGPTAPAYLTVEGRVLTLEMLARHKDSAPGFLALMIRCLVRDAPKVGFTELRLDAISEELVAIYSSYGFQTIGKPYSTPEWPWLVPMRRRL